MSCTSEAIAGPGLLSALEQRSEEEEAQLASGALVPSYLTQKLAIFRKKWFTPQRQEEAKRARRDFREAERLKAMVERDAASAAAKGQS